MASFLVEAYTPQDTSLEDVERRAGHAADQLSRAGRCVRYLRSIYVAEDEICFHLFDADSAEEVRLASDHARLDAQRIVEAVEIGGREPALT